MFFRLLFLFIIAHMSVLSSKEPIVTAEKILEHKREFGHLGTYQAPESVLICYQSSTMKYLLKTHPEFQPSGAVTHFYTDGQVGILGDFGVGAPGLAIKMEELIALGAKRFIAIGTAGSLMGEHSIGNIVLCSQALAEDGVAHLYYPDSEIVGANSSLMEEWLEFAKMRSLPSSRHVTSWSYSALFRETVEDMLRVHALGCSVVEMEAATLFAIGQDKGVQTLTLFVISDSITKNAWVPRVKDPVVVHNLHLLADCALDFAFLMAKKSNCI